MGAHSSNCIQVQRPKSVLYSQFSIGNMNLAFLLIIFYTNANANKRIEIIMSARFGARHQLPSTDHRWGGRWRWGTRLPVDDKETIVYSSRPHAEGSTKEMQFYILHNNKNITMAMAKANEDRKKEISARCCVHKIEPVLGG